MGSTSECQWYRETLPVSGRTWDGLNASGIAKRVLIDYSALSGVPRALDLGLQLPVGLQCNYLRYQVKVKTDKNAESHAGKG